MPDAVGIDERLLAELEGFEGIRHVSLETAERLGLCPSSRLPMTLRVLAEGALRRAGREPIDLAWLGRKPRKGLIEFYPARLLLQDFTGVPLMTDLASLRDALADKGVDPRRVNPRVPVDFVVDHALIAEHGGRIDAWRRNEAHEVARNRERFEFLKWCAGAFDNIRLLPPGTGIMHQLNLEHLATVVCTQPHASGLLAFPDSLLGTDSHTTMVNALGILALGVGGLEAEAALLGHGLLVSDPRVVGLRLTGALGSGVMANDLVLAIAERLRSVGVTGAFVEAFGDGVGGLALETRATISNMAPEYGATAVMFPIDPRTLDYLALTGRDARQIGLVEAYAKAQGLWAAADSAARASLYDDVIEFDLARVETSMAGPSRPEQRVGLAGVKASFERAFEVTSPVHKPLNGAGGIADGAVAIAAITSCTSTSNPGAMLTAGLLALKAVERGLNVKPWVKTTFAPGSRVVADYLDAAGLQPALDSLGFQVIGFGCTTCNGNSGSLKPEVAEAIGTHDVTVTAVLSGNRNFEGRIHPQVRAAYLAAPALVIAHAIAGSVRLDMTREPLGYDQAGRPVMLSDIWPSDAEVAGLMRLVTTERYRAAYAPDRLLGHHGWQSIARPDGVRYPWREDSTFLSPSPIAAPRSPKDLPDEIEGLKALAILGDGVSTDHLSPNGEILPDTPAARWLSRKGVAKDDLGTYAARRGQHAIAVRGTFANPHLLNELVGARGPLTRLSPTANPIPIVDAAMLMAAQGVGSLVIAGKRYGSGSSRDWAAKGLAHLGVRAVIAESFERIHRSNLIAVGVLPLTWPAGVTRKTLGLTGAETYALRGLRDGMRIGGTVEVGIARTGGTTERVSTDARIETQREAEVLMAGGLLSVLFGQLSGV